MKAVKIGGGCIKDAPSLLNLVRIMGLLLESNKNVLLVVSALGKTTRSLRDMFDFFIKGKFHESEVLFKKVKLDHIALARELFPLDDESFFKGIGNAFDDTFSFLSNRTKKSSEFVLDQILPIGEIISSVIVFRLLEKNLPGISTKLIGAKNLIVTDSNYGNADIDFKKSREKSVKEIWGGAFGDGVRIVITQGFIGLDSEGFKTTLGEEGSDYTLTSEAFINNAEEAVKYVNAPGLMTCDPNGSNGQNAKLISRISRSELRQKQESGEIVHVLHPRTLEPLELGDIPFYIRSFYNPEEIGTLVY